MLNRRPIVIATNRYVTHAAVGGTLTSPRIFLTAAVVLVLSLLLLHLLDNVRQLALIVLI